MFKVVMRIAVVLCVCGAPRTAKGMDVQQLLDRCSANLDKFRSWRLKCRTSREILVNEHKEFDAITLFDLRFDGERVCSRQWSWPAADQYGKSELDRAKANYLRVLWDGEIHSKYQKAAKNDPGQLFLDDLTTWDSSSRDFEVGSLRYRHEASCAMGRYGGTLERIDRVLRAAKEVSLRDGMENINGVPCYIIDARTKYGRFTVWVDPSHDFAISKWQIEASRAAGHLQYMGLTPYETYSEQSETTSFKRFDDIWIGTEMVRQKLYSREETTHEERAHTWITEFVPNPDHEVLGSFEQDDVPNGTLVIIAPVTHIRYVWHDGELVKHVDDDVVAQIDGILDKMMPSDDRHRSSAPAQIAEDEDAMAMAAEPNEVLPMVRRVNPYLKRRAHCGLYCIYSFLKLQGLDPDFRDLVLPEYFGRLRGSSMAELNRAAHDYGFHAGVATRLSSKALHQCPYQAILHVKAGPEEKQYDHYALYLGTEQGKAKVFSPPEEPELVSFADLAPLWDGYALLVSERPFDIDAIFQLDRQRLFFWGMVGVLAVLLAHFARRVWMAVAGAMPRRWVLGVAGAQAVALGLSALLYGGFYHFARDEGLLANASATASLQRAYTGSFIPKISERKTRRLLGPETVVIDARLAADYEKGHLDGAINLPVDANDALWEETVAKIPRGRPIVAYCQSLVCKYAEEVSTRLIEEGYSDIVIFKGGWAEWVEKHGKPETLEKEVEQEDASQDSSLQ